MQPLASEVLTGLAGAFAAQGVRWYLFGAQAVVLYGFVRQTADVDVTVEVLPAALPALISSLKTRGFEVSIATDVDRFIAETRVIPLIHRPTGMAVDLVLAGPGIESQFLDRAVPRVVAGVTLPVVSPEDLMVLKILAGRNKDVEDVIGVVKRQKKLDRTAVASRLRELEELLGQSDLLPAWEAALAAADRR